MGYVYVRTIVRCLENSNTIKISNALDLWKQFLSGKIYSKGIIKKLQDRIYASAVQKYVRTIGIFTATLRLQRNDKNKKITNLRFKRFIFVNLFNILFKFNYRLALQYW